MPPGSPVATRSAATISIWGSQRRVYFAGGEAVPQKKLFYALRPAAALRWQRGHPDAQIAPMHFPTLIAQCDPPADLAALVPDLIARTAVTRELGSQPLPPTIAAFIGREFEIARTEFEGRFEPIPEAAVQDSERFFREATLRS